MFNQAGLGSERRKQEEEYPAEFLEEVHRLATWVLELADRYGEQVFIRVIDPQSPLGLYKSVRHWVRRYPTFIVDGRYKCVGWDKEGVDALLQDRLRQRE